MSNESTVEIVDAIDAKYAQLLALINPDTGLQEFYQQVEDLGASKETARGVIATQAALSITKMIRMTEDLGSFVHDLSKRKNLPKDITKAAVKLLNNDYGS